MQYPIYPLKNVRETQGVNGSYSHKDTFAIDDGGKDSGICSAYAPCDCKIIRISSQGNGNIVYFESLNKVKLANGQVDYINFRMIHDNNISDLKVGQVFKQFDKCYDEGTSGKATGNHIHLQVAKGKYTGINLGSGGSYRLNNEMHPKDVFCMLKGYNTILKSSYSWKWVLSGKVSIGEPTTRDENKKQIEVKADDLNIRDNPNGSKLGVYINKGVYDVLEEKQEDNYLWVKTNVGWIAHSNEWSVIYEKKESIPPIVETPQEPVIEPIQVPKEEHEEIPIEEAIVEEDKPNEVIEPKTNWFVELIKTIIKFIQSFMRGEKK